MAVYTPTEQVPPVLDMFVNKTGESGFILALVKHFLARINTAKIHASVTDFSVSCGGGIRAAAKTVNIIVKIDGYDRTYPFVIGMFETAVMNERGTGNDTANAYSLAYPRAGVVIEDEPGGRGHYIGFLDLENRIGSFFWEEVK